MTVYEAIRRVDALMPNAMTDAEKISWLGQAEGFIINDILAPRGTEPNDGAPLTPSSVLLAPAPYDMMYLYLCFYYICLANGELKRAAEMKKEYSAAFDLYRHYYNREHPMPVTHRKAVG